MWGGRADRRTGRFKAVAYALLVHAAVVGLLVINIQVWSPKPDVTPPVIQARVVTEEPREKARQAQKKREAIRKKQALAAARRRRLAAEKKKRKARQREEGKKRSLAVETKKREQRRQQQAEKLLKEQLAEEEAERFRAVRERKAHAEAARYKALIRQKVSRNWIRPPRAAGGLQCRVRVRLVPGGEVLEAKVVRTSGDPVFDRSVENAVFKAAPLPIPEDPELFEFFREIEFLFNPEALQEDG